MIYDANFASKEIDSFTKKYPLLGTVYFGKDYKNPQTLEVEEGPLISTSADEVVYSLGESFNLYGNKNTLFAFIDGTFNFKEGVFFIDTKSVVPFQVNSKELLFTTENSILLVDSSRDTIYILSGEISDLNGKFYKSGIKYEVQIDSISSQKFDIKKLKDIYEYASVIKFASSINTSLLDY